MAHCEFPEGPQNFAAVVEKQPPLSPATENQLSQGGIYVNGADYESKQLMLELEAVKEERTTLAMELNKLRAEDRVRRQLPDNELIDQARNLRREIKNFCIQYFDDDVLENLGKDLEYFRHLQATTPEKSTYRAYLDNPNRRAQVVTAFLWKILASEILGRFHWAGDKLAQSLRDLKEFLAPGNESDPDEELAFQKWQAKTTEFLLGAMRGRAAEGQEAKDDVKRLKAGIVRKILQTLGQELIPESKDMAVQLDNILDLALALDKDISQQVVRVEWRYDDEGLIERNFDFDENDMEVYEDDYLSKANKCRRVRKRTPKVRMVIAPSLVKWSMPYGEDFPLQSTTLMKMVVLL